MYIPMDTLIVGVCGLVIGFVIGLIASPQSCTRNNQSQNFDIGVCQLSRPRPRRVAPIGWPEEIRRRRAGLMYSLYQLSSTQGQAVLVSWYSLVFAHVLARWNAGERLGRPREWLSGGQGDCLSEASQCIPEAIQGVYEVLTRWAWVGYLFVSLALHSQA